MNSDPALALNRWGLYRNSRGGVSGGWTSFKTFLNYCQRFGFWSRLYGGGGLGFPPTPPNGAALYGKAWHKSYCAMWKKEPLKEALLKFLDEEQLEANAYALLIDEVQRDMDWYWQQERSDERLTVLACEEELVAEIGRHTLRGTPDLVAMEPSGSVLVPDHKSHTVLSYDQRGNPRIEIMPRQQTVAKYRTSRQFPYYLALWNRLHPDQRGYDALLNMVPSHVTAVLGLLNERKGNVQFPKVTRVDLEPYTENYLDEVLAQVLNLCDYIADWWDEGGEWPPPTDSVSLREALLLFPENDESCVGYGGRVCGFYDLCRGTPEERKFLIDESFALKEVH